MAKQINFLGTDNDLKVIEVAFCQRGDVDILTEEPTDDSMKDLIPLKTLPIPLSLVGRVSLSCCLAPSGVPRMAKIRRVSPVKIVVDMEVSCLIEFSRPYYDGKIMRPGRLYYQNKPYVNGEFQDKDPGFCRWADSVIATLRKTLRRDPEIGLWVGTDAAAKLAAHQITVLDGLGQVWAS